MSPLREAVRGIDLWGYEVGLPDVDPAFQSSCCGNSYCKKTWLDITMASFSEENCIPIWLRCIVGSSMALNGLNQYNTHQFVVFEQPERV